MTIESLNDLQYLCMYSVYIHICIVCTKWIIEELPLLKITPSQTLGQYAKIKIPPLHIIWLFQKFEKLTPKQVILSMGLSAPPLQIDFKK